MCSFPLFCSFTQIGFLRYTSHILRYFIFAPSYDSKAIKVRYCIYWENMPFIPSSSTKITIVNGALSWQNDEKWQSRTGLSKASLPTTGTFWYVQSQSYVTLSFSSSLGIQTGLQIAGAKVQICKRKAAHCARGLSQTMYKNRPSAAFCRIMWELQIDLYLSQGLLIRNKPKYIIVQLIVL